jgi:hypothetical protein
MKKRFIFSLMLVYVLVLSFTGCASFSSMSQTVTPSLDGVWNRGDIVITFNGNNAVYTQFNSNYSHLAAVNSGVINIGDQVYRNIRQTDNLRWTGEVLMFRTEDDSSGKILRYKGTQWANCTIIMSADGNTIHETVGGFSPAIYRRVQ